MDRRRFLAAATATAVASRLHAQAPTATLAIDTHSPGPTFPADFLGLSYEARQLAVPGFFSASNRDYVALIRQIAPTGILRLGGNTSDGGYWLASPSAPVPPQRPAHPFGNYLHPVTPFAITPDLIRDLRTFLDATNWNCIYGVNLGTNNPSLAADEAAAVAQILGPRLTALQIGNEADRYATNFRRDPKTWSPSTYMDEWLTFAHAIVARVPGIPLGAPDLAAIPAWINTAADRIAADPIRANVRTLTYHYYIDGPPSNPAMDIPKMLHADPALLDEAHIMQHASAELGVTWRMTEGNTVWNGGKPGVSDVFASALWSADYAHPYYTAITTIHGKHQLQPIAYGMNFASAFAGATLLPTTFNPGPINATAYAARTPHGKLIAAIINKDLTQPLTITIKDHNSLCARTLNSTSPTSHTVQWDDHCKTIAGQIVIPPTTAVLTQLS